MKVWITRTQPGAGRTAVRLQAVGLIPLIDPVLEVRPLDASADTSGFDGLVFTSPNAVAGFARIGSERSLPALAVGEATAEALSDAGFSDIHTAGGDIGALAALLATRPARASNSSTSQPMICAIALTLSSAGGANSPRSTFDR